MNDDLYFLPMIAQALQQPDPGVALRDAFGRIRALGHEPRYRRGYKQFLVFLDMATQTNREGAGEPVAELVEGALRPLTMDVLVERDGDLVSTCSLEMPPAARTVDGIVAGTYLLRLDTGRVIWEGRLADEDLLWTRAFPKRPLRVAADTGEPRRHMTREIPLLDGTLILRVFAGVESGAMEIEVRTPEVPK